MSEQNEIDLIKSIQAPGDKRAFGLLIDHYQDMVYNCCFRFFGNRDDAFDCAQEIFISVYKNIGSFKFKSKFSTWLYTITINTCKNTANTKLYKSGKMLDSIEQNETIDHTSKQLIGNGRDPEKVFLGKELSGVIEHAITQLEGNQKTVLILRDIEGRSYEEIAEISGLKTGTVKSTLARARLKVANVLKKYL